MVNMIGTQLKMRCIFILLFEYLNSLWAYVDDITVRTIIDFKYIQKVHN
jgi:hypothetical protein